MPKHHQGLSHARPNISENNSHSEPANLANPQKIHPFLFQLQTGTRKAMVPKVALVVNPGIKGGKAATGGRIISGGFFLAGQNGGGGDLVLLLRNEGKFWYVAPCCCILVDGCRHFLVHAGWSLSNADGLWMVAVASCSDPCPQRTFSLVLATPPPPQIGGNFPTNRGNKSGTTFSR